MSGGGDGVGAVGYGQRGSSGHSTEVQYLRPNQRSGHDIAVELTIAAGVRIDAVRSTTHDIHVVSESASRKRIQLASHHTIPNKDLVVRYRIGGDAIQSGLVLQPSRDGNGGHFAMLLVPPDQMSGMARRPVEFVFVIDTSGSMNGKALAIAQKAVIAALDEMEDHDTFQILRFSDDVSGFGRTPIAATRHNIGRAKDYLRTLNANGGTMMMRGIEAALDPPTDFSRQRYVVFLTDGFIGNEDEVLATLERKLGSSRVFSFGIGASPNRSLLEDMAKLGRGAAAYVGLSDKAHKAMDAFFDRVSHPALADLEIDWGGLDVSDVYPQRIPDLFVGRPVVLTGRYAGDARGVWSTPIEVRGRTGRGYDSLAVTAIDEITGTTLGGLDAAWARAKIADLSDQARRSGNAGWAQREIERVALTHNLVSAFTSFVAVDASRRTRGDYGISVGTPVPVPEGTRYDTTVPGG